LSGRRICEYRDIFAQHFIKFLLQRRPAESRRFLNKRQTIMDVWLPLNTGGTIPALGLGTWQSRQGDAKKAVAHAIRAGYRHIDTAFVYGNEAEVGEAIREAINEGIVKRNELFVTTKLWSTYHSRVEQNLDLSLQRLGLDYIDLCPSSESLARATR
jgi:glycerol 2-dehydrogenase (NADP+)